MSEEKNAGEKPGYRTTEFWLTVLADLLGLLLMAGVFAPEACSADWCTTALQILGGAIALLSTMGYTAARTVAKNGEKKRATALALEALRGKPSGK